MAHLLARILLITMAAAAVVGAVIAYAAGSLAWHMLAHVLLLDVLAVGLVLAVPRSLRKRVADAIDARCARSGASPFAHIVRSPIGVLVLWVSVASFSMLPLGHRLAMHPAGHVIEPILLAATGVLFWRVTFDPHESRPIRIAIYRGGLPWWGRHVLAMVGRMLILPAIAALWLWPAGAYGDASARDQMLGASVVLGTEMTVFFIAATLFFCFFVVFVREEP